MSAQTINWGIVGCGDVTEQKSGPAYNKVTGFHLEAVMRRDKEKAIDYARRHNVATVFDSAEALINSPNIDAVYIATPPDSHKALALEVAKAGKPCCIEKPLTPSYADSKTIVDTFHSAKVPLFVAYYRRSLPRFLQVKAWLDNGEIGEARHIQWHLCKPASETDLLRQPNWRTQADVAPAGYFDDLASHGLDLFAHLLGPYQKVRGLTTNQQGLYTAKDAVTACWLHKNNVTGSGSWHFGSYQRYDNVLISGSEGEIRFSVFGDLPVMLDNGSGLTTLTIDHPENVQLNHIEGMRNKLLFGAPHVSTGDTALHTSWVMEQIVKSG